MPIYAIWCCTLGLPSANIRVNEILALPTRASHCQYENSGTLAPLNFHALNETLALGIPRYTCSQLVRTALFWENYILGKLYTNTFLTVSNRVSSSVAAVGTLTFTTPPSRSSVAILRDLTQNSHHYLRNAPSTQEIAHKDQYTSHLQNKSAQKLDGSNSIFLLTNYGATWFMLILHCVPLALDTYMLVYFRIPCQKLVIVWLLMPHGKYWHWVTSKHEYRVLWRHAVPIFAVWHSQPYNN